MIKLQAPGLAIPHTPPMPVSNIHQPRIWNLKPSFDPEERSQNRMLRCLRAEIRPERDGSLVVLLDLKYYEINSSPKLCVNILLGNIGVYTFVEPADCGDGTTSVSAILPIAALKEGLPVTLEVLSDDIIREKLPIGIVQLISVQSAAELRRGRAAPSIYPPIVPYVSPSPPAAAEEDETAEHAHEVPMEDSMLPRETIPPDYQRLWLRIIDDVDTMTENWTAAEDKAGRRLVRFWREQAGSLVKLRFATHPPLDRFNEKVHMVISCIKLPDREGHHVTSFDIVKLAEFILDLTLNTDMKNRARRNMASVGCDTLPRNAGNEGSKTEAFNFLMRFGDPKPRSIEKSIKVYAWNRLEQCLSKILQRFIIYLPDIRTGPAEFEHQLEAVSRWKRSQSAEALSTRPTKTRRDSRIQAYACQDVPKLRPLIKLLQTPPAQQSKKTSSEDEPMATPIKQEAMSPTPIREEQKEVQNEQLLARIQTRQTLHLQIAEASPASPSANPIASSPVQPNEVLQDPLTRPPHPPLQRDSSSNSLTIPHHGWTNPSGSDCNSSGAVPSPTDTFESSLASYSPAQSNTSSPRFCFWVGPNVSVHQQQQCTQDIPTGSRSSSSVYSMSPGTSHQGMTTSTLLMPNWPSHPHLGVYVHPPMVAHGYCEQIPLEYPPPDMDFHRSGTASMPASGPVLVRGLSVNPNHAQYELERVQMLHLQNSQAYSVAQQMKEDFKDIDTDEWLDNDYIMAQENKQVG